MTNKNKMHPFATILYRTAILFTAMDILISLLYLVVIAPMVETPFSEILGGGISLSRRAIMLLIAFAVALIWSFISKKKTSVAIWRYISIAAMTYTVQIGVLAAIYGFYLVTYYNPYIPVTSSILRGPSFMLSFAALLFAFVFPCTNSLLRTKKLPTFPKLALHCVSLMLLTYLTYAVFADAFVRMSAFLILCAVFVACYLVAALLYFRLTGALKEDENAASDYQPLFQSQQASPDKVGAKPKQKK